MTMLRWIRMVGLVAAGAVLVSAAVLWSSVSPAGAASRDGLCTLLPTLCPPSAKAPPTTKARVTTTTPTTKAPATTAAPTTKASTAATQRSTTASQTATAPVGAAGMPTTASVGAAGLPAPVSAGAEVPALGPDGAAPQLAVTASPNTTVLARVPQALSGFVGTATSGLPNDHKTLRIALSILVVLVAAVATAQLPASRRFPAPAGDPPS